jgi:hypothetical protein
MKTLLVPTSGPWDSHILAFVKTKGDGYRLLCDFRSVIEWSNWDCLWYLILTWSCLLYFPKSSIFGHLVFPFIRYLNNCLPSPENSNNIPRILCPKGFWKPLPTSQMPWIWNAPQRLGPHPLGGGRTFRRWSLIKGSWVIGGMPLRRHWDPSLFLFLLMVTMRWAYLLYYELLL